MRIFNLISLSAKSTSLLLCLFTSTLTLAEDKQYPQFMEDTPNSKLKIDFEPVNLMLDANVLNMGPSRRTSAKRAELALGTKLRHHVAVATHNEGNRFTYELIIGNKHQDKVSEIKRYLESLPSQTPLHLYTKQEQLAYWLNLYNVTLINEIVKRYPWAKLEKLLLGTDSLMNQKLININGIELSLNDIQYNVLYKKYNKEPLIIYGLHQGHIGSPNINKKAYTGTNVYKLLKNNAIEFINSNRGTNTKNDTLEVSSYYSRNADYFPDFENDLRSHLLQFADKETREKINQSNTIESSINNWKIADLYGSDRVFGGGVAINSAAVTDFSFSDKAMENNNSGGKFKLTPSQSDRLRQLMKVRAKNFGSTSVTLTDIESEAGN